MKRFISVALTVVLLLMVMISNVFAGEGTEFPAFDESKTVTFKFDSSSGTLSNGIISVKAYVDTIYNRIVIQDNADNVAKLFKSLEELNCDITVQATKEDIFIMAYHKPYKGVKQSSFDSIRILNRTFSGYYCLWKGASDFEKIKPSEPIGTYTRMSVGIEQTTFDLALRFTLENLYFTVNYSDGIGVIPASVSPGAKYKLNNPNMVVYPIFRLEFLELTRYT